MYIAIVLLLALGDSLVSSSTATSYSDICLKISDAISPESTVYYPNSTNYAADIDHFMTSSSQNSSCSVEPSTAADVGKILRILGSSRTPFAVKGGGHASNPGWSSTPGVQIAMTQFSEITYDANSQTATIGAGLVWDQVYSTLEPQGVNVLGGRVTGVSVAGFILGGGYSWKTNQHGLAIDTVQAFELVLPNGTVTIVTATSNTDLFFGLKGGFNNFGIVTKFVMKTFPQTPIWGGQVIYGWDSLDYIIAATNKFSDTNTDPKAAMIVALNFDYQLNVSFPLVNVIMFYDAPTPPPAIFDDFLAIPSIQTPILGPQTFSTLALLSAANMTAGYRGIFNTISLTNYTIDILSFIAEQLKDYTNDLDDAVFLSYDIEPFLPSLYSHSTHPSAYPPTRSRGLLPLNIYFAWRDPVLDGVFHDAINTTAASIKARAVAYGQDVANAFVYGNYAIFNTPLKDIYGHNLGRLQGIKAKYDPNGVMGLAGGFHFD